MDTVPVIDIAPFLSGTPEGIASVAKELGRACEEIGFFQITGYGVSEEFIQEVYDMSRCTASTRPGSWMDGSRKRRPFVFTR
jgi:isopenicillin N synthase-like dioxygenase